MHLIDLTLDMSAVSLSSHVGESGVSVGAGVAVGGGGGDDIRQPSVDGLHSPSSPNAPIAVAKQGTCTMYMYAHMCVLLYLHTLYFVPSVASLTVILLEKISLLIF